MLAQWKIYHRFNSMLDLRKLFFWKVSEIQVINTASILLCTSIHRLITSFFCKNARKIQSLIYKHAYLDMSVVK